MAFDLSTAKPAASGGFDLSTARPTSEVPTGRSVGGFVSNIPSSAGRLAEGIGSMILSPIDTASNILDIGAGALQNALPKAFVDFVNSGDSPEKADTMARFFIASAPPGSAGSIRLYPVLATFFATPLVTSTAR